MVYINLTYINLLKKIAKWLWHPMYINQKPSTNASLVRNLTWTNSKNVVLLTVIFVPVIFWVLHLFHVHLQIVNLKALK